MARNRVLIGNIGTEPIQIENDDIVQVNFNQAADPTGLTLPVGTLEVVFNSALDDITAIPYGTDIQVLSDDKLYLYYAKHLTRTGAGQYTLEAQDFLGVLDDYFYPGIYPVKLLIPYTLAELLEEMLTATSSYLGNPVPEVMQRIKNRLSYQATSIRSMLIRSGYIGQCTRREAFQQIMFCCNVLPVQSGESIIISRVAEAISGTVFDDNIYQGGSVTEYDPISSVTVTEHSYVINWNQQDSDFFPIFDNMDSGSDDDVNYTLINGVPISDIRYEGFSSARNYYTYVKTVGKGRITGVRYIDNKRELTAVNPDGGNGEAVQLDITSISVQQASIILERLKSYYFAKRREVSQDIVLGTEIAGRRYDMRNAFGDTESTFISDMSVSLSNTTKAAVTAVTGWKPYNNLPYFSSVVLTGSGVWEVPEGVNLFTVTLIGGGNGGDSGLRGPDGKPFDKLPTANLNGATGENGAGGKIATFTVLRPSKSYIYSCGLGGVGGAVCNSTEIPNHGADGSATTFGSYTSAGGTSRDEGYTDGITGKVYGRKINIWPGFDNTKVYTSGGYGIEDDFVAYPASEIAYDTYSEPYSPRRNIIPSIETAYFTSFNNSSQTAGIIAGHGAPGGNAAGASGMPGTLSKWKVKGKSVQLGFGGDGATPAIDGYNPMIVYPESYGFGGGGGFGGGAGGSAGFVLAGSGITFHDGVPGFGGLGGAGGDGAPGCIIINY